MLGDVALDVGNTACENSPKLLKMRRISLLSIGQTIDEDDAEVVHPDYSMYLYNFWNLQDKLT